MTTTTTTRRRHREHRTRAATATNAPRARRLPACGKPCRNAINDAPRNNVEDLPLTRRPRNLAASPPRTRHPSCTAKHVRQCRHELNDVQLTYLGILRTAFDDKDDEGGWWWKGGECGGEQRGRCDVVKRARLGVHHISSVGETTSGEHRPELVVCNEEQGFWTATAMRNERWR